MRRVLFFFILFSSALYSEDRFFTIEGASSEKLEELVNEVKILNRNQEAIIFLLGQLTRVAMYFEPEVYGNGLIEKENQRTEELFRMVKKIQAAEEDLPIASFTQ